MNTFRALCFAAAMGLVVTCALPQGRGRGNDDKGGKSTGGSSGTESRGKSDEKGKSDGGTSRGSGPATGGSSSGGSSSGQGKSDGGRGRGDSGGGSSSGPSRGSGSSGGSSGGSVGGGPSRGSGSGGSSGGPSSGGSIGGGQSRGGNPSGPVPNSGGGSVGGGNQKSDGDINRGGRTTGGGTGSGGSSSGGNSGGNIRSGSGSGSSGGGRHDDGIGRGGSSGSGGTIGGGSGNSGGTRGGWGQGGNNGNPTVISDDNTRNGIRDSMLGRKSSHSGTAHYGNSNNVSTITKVGGTTIIGRAPVNVHNIGKGDLITRKDNPSLHRGGYRTGYYFYDPRWCDDYFWYPYYSCDPWSRRCVVSPWYFYVFLPGYISWDRCHFYNLRPWSVWSGTYYSWNRPVSYNYDNWGRGIRASDADYAVDDIVNAFERADRRAAGRLISQRSEVSIYIDGNYSYTLNSEDFYDMFMDATQNTRTKRYSIDRVETGRDENNRECYRVTARHEYEDPWGVRTSVNHYYELTWEGRNLIISKFGVSGGN